MWLKIEQMLVLISILIDAKCDLTYNLYNGEEITIAFLNVTVVNETGLISEFREIGQFSKHSPLESISGHLIEFRDISDNDRLSIESPFLIVINCGSSDWTKVNLPLNSMVQKSFGLVLFGENFFQLESKCAERLSILSKPIVLITETSAEIISKFIKSTIDYRTTTIDFDRKSMLLDGRHQVATVYIQTVVGPTAFETESRTNTKDGVVQSSNRSSSFIFVFCCLMILIAILASMTIYSCAHQISIHHRPTTSMDNPSSNR